MINLFGEENYNPKRSLSAFFGVPPFSILDTTNINWLQRKRVWNKMIGDTGQARKDVLTKGKTSMLSKINGTSILDPVLSELMVNWFTNENFKTFDPFAGDTVFGFVSATLGRPFIGIELRGEQVDFNQNKCNQYNLKSKYICDTSENMDLHVKDGSMDFVFSCPPYADLEKYSDLPNDLSNKSHDEFFILLRKILKNTYSKLKENRFAVIVIGEVRTPKGDYINLVPNTIRYMMSAGYYYYNEIILVNSVGTLPLRSAKSMNATRKIGKRHQNILVFYKGDLNKINETFPVIMEDNKFYDKKIK